MEVAVETTEGLQRRMTVQVPEDDIAAEVSNRLRDMTRSASVPGFRPGKVPLKILSKRYGKRVREEVVGELVQRSFQDAITEKSLRPAGGPVIDPLQAEPGKGLSYTAVFEVYPEVDLAAVEGLEVVRPTAEVEESDIDNMLDHLRQQRVEFNEVERAAADGDRVSLDFEGTVDGEAFDGGKAEGALLVLGSGRTVPEFEAGIAGMSAGESATIDVTFPADYGDENLAGKEAQFVISIHKVEEPSVPEVDEAFVKALGVEDGTIESFRAEIRNNMERELAGVIRARAKDNVIDALLSSNTVELPAALVTEESNRLFQARIQGLRQQGVDPDALDFGVEAFEAEARRRVGVGLVFAEIIKTHSLNAEPAKVHQRVLSIASAFEEPQKVAAHLYEDKTRLAEIQSAVLEDQVVDLVLSKAQVSEQVTTFEALTKHDHAASDN